MPSLPSVRGVSEDRSALRIVLLYVIFGSLWILFSDLFIGDISRLSHIHSLTVIAVLKGLGFVLLTAVLLYVLIERSLAHRKFSDAALRESETRYRSVISSIQNGIILEDAQGLIQACNSTAQHILGLNKQEIVERSMGARDWHAIREDGTPIPAEDLPPRVVMRTGLPCQSVIMGVRRGESRVWLSVNSEPLIRAGEVVPYAVVTSFTDITERRRAEEALRESEERFRSAFDNSSVGMALTTLDGGFMNVNQSFCDTLGYTREEMLPLGFRGITHPEDLAASEEGARRLLSGEARGFQIEKRYLHKKGHTVWARLNVSLVSDRSGEPSYFIAQIEDISKRRELEEQFRQSQKMEAVGRLAGGVAHDFNNLLMVINGHTEMLLEHLEPGHPLRLHAEQANQAGARASALTRQLLAFSRKQVLEPRVVLLNDVLVDLQSMLRRLIGEDVDLSFAPGKNVGHVRVDPGQLEQAMMNLAVNARDAMPNGGHLRMRTFKTQLDSETAQRRQLPAQGEYVVVEVSDSGTGMDENILAHIFEPFFTTKGVGKGTGLGLSMVYGFMQQSGGQVEVESEPGKGSTFRLYFPTAEVEAAMPARLPAVVERPPGGSETVLVVEDEPAIRRVTCDLLRMSGYTVLGAGSAAEAIAQAKNHPQPIHLLLTDVVMPDMSGPELAHLLTSFHPGMAVLFMSGYTHDEIGERGVLEEGIALLPKPFTREILTRRIRQLLDRSQSASQG